MNNYPVKFALMTAPYHRLSPQVFLDRTPEECIRVLKAVLPQRTLNVLEFALTDPALLLLLEHEVEVENRQFKPVKKLLDGDSWLHVNGLPDCPKSEQKSVIESLTEALWRETAHCDPESDLDERLHLRRELSVLLHLYEQQFADRLPNGLNQLNCRAGFAHFFNLIVVQAMVKADGIRVLLGEQSPYTRLWQHKQRQFLRYARYMEQHQLRFIA